MNVALVYKGKSQRLNAVAPLDGRVLFSPWAVDARWVLIQYLDEKGRRSVLGVGFKSELGLFDGTSPDLASLVRQAWAKIVKMGALDGFPVVENVESED